MSGLEISQFFYIIGYHCQILIPVKCGIFCLLKEQIPNEMRICLSSAEEIVPFCSLSKTRNPSVKSSKEGSILFLLMVWRMGKNVSKEIRASVENKKDNKDGLLFL